MGLRQSSGPFFTMTGSDSPDFPWWILGFQTLGPFSRFICPWVFGTRRIRKNHEIKVSNIRIKRVIPRILLDVLGYDEDLRALTLHP